jgi:hypothetical protein
MSLTRGVRIKAHTTYVIRRAVSVERQLLEDNDSLVSHSVFQFFTLCDSSVGGWQVGLMLKKASSITCL